MIPVSQGKPYAGNLHVRFEEGASASANAEAEGSTPRQEQALGALGQLQRHVAIAQ